LHWSALANIDKASTRRIEGRKTEGKGRETTNTMLTEDWGAKTVPATAKKEWFSILTLQGSYRAAEPFVLLPPHKHREAGSADIGSSPEVA
jgi:hypothetical protein